MAVKERRISMERIEGLTIDLALDSTRLTRGLTGLRDRLRTVNSEMRANLSAFSRGDNSIARHETKLNSLNRKLQVQREVTRAARAEYERMVREHGEGSRQADRAAVSYNREVANLNNLNRAVDHTTQELERLREAQRIAETGWGRLSTRLTNLSGRLTSLGQNMQSVGRSMTSSFGVATAAVGGVLAMATKKAVDFESQMSSVKSVMAPAEVKQFGGELEKLAITMGSKTKYSAMEAAQGIEELIKAGVSVEDILKGGLQGALNLATAGELDLASAAEIASTALNAFKKDGLSVAKAADILAGAANASATDVGELKFGLSMVSAVASGVGLTFEDTSTALAVFAQNGLKGSDAGTSLKTMLLRLSPTTKEAAAAFDQLGLSSYNTAAGYKYLVSKGITPAGRSVEDIQNGLKELTKQELGSVATKAQLKKGYEENLKYSGLMSSAFYDENGELKSMADISETLKNAMSGLNSEQRQTYLNTMFGTDAIRAANILFNEGADGVNKMNAEMNKVKAADVAKEKLNNLKGAVVSLKSAFETAQISVGTALIPALKGLTKVLQGAVNWFNNLSPNMQKAIAIGGGLLTVVLALGTGIGIMLTVVGGAITGLGALAGVMAPVAASIAAAGGLLKWLRLGLMALSGPIGITIGVITLLSTGFMILYKKSETFRNMIGKLKDVFLNGFGIIADYFKEKIAEMKSFWDSNGSQILLGFKNIVNGILFVLKPFMPLISGIFKITFKIILAIIKTVWENIKGVINGGLKVIKGLILVFSGLFTGDFKKMWEGIKNVFSGAIQFIWNFVQLMFWGKMLKGILSLGKLLINAFKGSWGSIKGVFSSVIKWIVDFVKSRFTSMKNTVNSVNTTLRNLINTIWNGILSFFRTVARSIYDSVINRFTTLKNTINTIFTAIKNLVRTIWNAIKDNIYNPIKSAVTNTISKFNNLKSNISSIFSSIKTKVAGYVSDMITNVKNMPGKMANGIKNAAGKVKDAMAGIGNNMIAGVATGVNGVIKGINWVLDKLGVKSKLKEWTVPKYADGTDGHPGGLAVVGDGTGSNAGKELITTPNGQQYLSPAKPTLVNLPKGTHVLSASMTKDLIPHYAFGTVGKTVKKGAKKIKDAALNVWEYASNPSKLLDLALDKLGVSIPTASDIVGKIAKGGFTKVKDSAVNFIKDKIKGIFDFGGGSGIPNVSGSGVQRWAGVATQALMMTGQYNKANLDRLLYQMQTESGGNPRAINLWDINAKRGTPSKGLMQVIDPTFRAYAMPGYNTNIWDPLSNILASIRYAMARYGSLARAYRGVGYATGGLINNDGLYRLAEGGYPEWVIPTDPRRRTDAMKLLALAGKDIGGNKRPNQLPGMRAGNDSVMMQLLEATLKQNQILMQLLKKDSNVYISGEKVTDSVNNNNAIKAALSYF